MQLDATEGSHNTVKKRPSRMSNMEKDGKLQGSVVKGHPRSLVARIQIPVMDKEKARLFQIASTLNLS